jgi:hypothetical protein
MKFYFLLFLFSFNLFFFYSTKIGLAEENDIIIESGTKKFEDLIFEVAPGTQHTGELLITNKSNHSTDVVLFIAPDRKTSLVEAMKQNEGNDLFTKTLFYSDAPPEKYQKMLKENNGDIVLLCNKYEESDDDALKTWCVGDRSTTITIQPNEAERVPFTIDISPEAENHSAYVTAVLEDKNDDQVLDQQKLVYQIPIKEARNLELNSFIFRRLFDLKDIKAWWQAGRQDEYVAELTVENKDEIDGEAIIFVKTNNLFSNNEKRYEQKISIKSGEKKIFTIQVLMPKFGKVEVVGGLQIGSGDSLQEFVSEPIINFSLPIREIIAILFALFIFIMIMWRRKKDLDKVTGGSRWVEYKISPGDNIMSVAYQYGISWKELAFKNEIRPPYTLVPESVIMVPPRVKKISKNKNMQKSNNFNHNEVKSGETFSRQRKATVIGEDNFPTQIPAKNNSIKKSVSGLTKNSEISEKSGNLKSKSSTSSTKNNQLNIRAKRPGVVRLNANSNINRQESKRRSMDIQWMHEDEDAFSEAMNKEVKAINFKIKLMVVIIIGLLALIAFWFFQYGGQELMQDTASINELLEQSEEAQNSNSENSEQSEENSAETEDKNDESKDENNSSEDSKDDEENSTETVKDLTAPSEISVQVLNGGAKSGVAGTITKLLKTAEYKTKTASNASNKVEGVVIYYQEDFADEVKEIVKILEEDYENITTEESNEVSKKYGVNIVIVAGK